MDIRDLFLSCRKGDIERVRHLVETKEVDVNVRDKWDSTPLYYACLCGHISVVQFLLDNGAKCEANTFDGERCLYGALSPEIRNLLKNYKVVTGQTLRRDLYYEFLRKLLRGDEFADFLFVVHGREFRVHKCILAARSAYFSDMFCNKWRSRSWIVIDNPMVVPDAFEGILQYLYTGRLETHVACIEDVRLLAKQCHMSSLLEQLSISEKQAHLFESSKPGTCVTTLVVEQPHGSFELNNDLGVLAEEALPQEFCQWAGRFLPFDPIERTPLVDVIFEVENYQFFCHKVFFQSRSEYFKALLIRYHQRASQDAGPSTSFEDESNDSGLPVVPVYNISASHFVYILYYIYQDRVELDPNIAFEILLAADMFLLPGLKSICASYIAECLDCSNCVSVLKAARLFRCHRLEDQCYQFMANHIDEMVEQYEFSEMILEDAREVKKREETDSIDIVDNIRFHLTASSMDEAQEQLEVIDELLEQLNLEA